MSALLRSALRTPQARFCMGLLAAWLCWQGWLMASAPGKIDPALAGTSEKLAIRVTLPFEPERFHVLMFQKYGRVSGTEGNTVELRNVKRGDLQAIARHYWVSRLAPLPPDS